MEVRRFLFFLFSFGFCKPWINPERKYESILLLKDNMSVNRSLPSACGIGCLEITLFSYLCNRCVFLFCFFVLKRKNVNFWNTLGITCQSSKPFVTSQPSFERVIFGSCLALPLSVAAVVVGSPWALSFSLSCLCRQSCWPPCDLVGKQSQLQEDCCNWLC